MNRFRIIPALIIKNDYLVKGINYRNHKYVGDPLNAVKIFNEKEVDELVILDISAQKRGINFDFIEQIANQAFMPLAYGGGITSVSDARRILRIGAEKIILNTTAAIQPRIVKELSEEFGSSTIVIAVDVKKNWLNKETVWYNNASVNTKITPEDFVLNMQYLGAGEIILTDIDREGTAKGYNSDLVKRICACLSIPVIAHGGAGSIEDFAAPISSGAAAVAAGSLFVFWGKHRAVLINYPKC